VNPGQFARVKALSAHFGDVVERSTTGLLAYHFHANQDGTEVANVQVHADAASMDAYLPLVRSEIAQALELTQTRRIDVFGAPGLVLAEVLQHNLDQGVAVNVMPSHLAGFSR
jgi:hypothetical protein